MWLYFSYILSSINKFYQILLQFLLKYAKINYCPFYNPINMIYLIRGGNLSKQSNQKLKLLYIYKLLYEKTDEYHTVTVNNIISYLNTVGIPAERKSIYDDIEALQSFGIDIKKSGTKINHYNLVSRDFELYELKILIDCVQSSKFITHAKSLDLVDKLQKLTSGEEAKDLHRQVFVYQRIKSMDESVFRNVDSINNAISQGKKISFKYWSWTTSKERSYKKDGEAIIINPVTLAMDSDNYYLVSYSSKYKDFTHYRVDKIDTVKILDDDCEKPDKTFKPDLYSKSIFSMYGGDLTDVKIRFNSSTANAVIDRFGTDVYIRKEDDNYFIANLKVSVSPTFLTWILGFGGNAKILSPEWVINEVYKLGYDAIVQYE